MSLVPWGIWAASGGALFEDSYDLLATEILTSAQGSVTFASLGDYASDYQHLQIRAVVRTDRTSASSDPVTLQFNGNTGTNYSRHGLVSYQFGGSGGVVSNAASSQTSILLSQAVNTNGATANSFGAIVGDILDPFSSSKNTTVRALPGMNAAFSAVELRSGGFFNTASIYEIKLEPLVGSNFVTGSRFSLYGLKAGA